MPVLFRINQYNATKLNLRTAKSHLVAELGPVQPQLVLYNYQKYCVVMGGWVVVVVVVESDFSVELWHWPS